MKGSTCGVTSLTGSPVMSEYFFAGLNDGGASIELSETEMSPVKRKVAVKSSKKTNKTNCSK